MGKPAVTIDLTDEQLAKLESLERRRQTTHGLAQRAEITDSDEGGQWIRPKTDARFDRRRSPDSTKPDSLKATLLTVE